MFLQTFFLAKAFFTNWTFKWFIWDSFFLFIKNMNIKTVLSHLEFGIKGSITNWTCVQPYKSLIVAFLLSCFLHLNISMDLTFCFSIHSLGFYLRRIPWKFWKFWQEKCLISYFSSFSHSSPQKLQPHFHHSNKFWRKRRWRTNQRCHVVKIINF